MADYEVIILGGGPAGLTAGLYAARSGLKTLLLEGNLPGGQASTTNELENYPGSGRIGGPELMMKFEEQAKEAGLDIQYQGVIQAYLKEHALETRSQRYQAQALILATGAARRKLGAAGEDMLAGRGVSYCATCDGALYRGKPVAVVGGGNTAAEDALYLAGTDRGRFATAPAPSKNRPKFNYSDGGLLCGGGHPAPDRAVRRTGGHGPGRVHRGWRGHPYQPAGGIRGGRLAAQAPAPGDHRRRRRSGGRLPGPAIHTGTVGERDPGRSRLPRPAIHGAATGKSDRVLEWNERNRP